MSRRRRALLLLGLAITLGSLAASDVHRREQTLKRKLGPIVGVVVAVRPLRAGKPIPRRALAVRRIPARYAQPGAFALPGELTGARAAANLPRGASITAASLDRGDAESPTGPPIRAGERVADVIATGSPQLIQPGGRVDVLVTRESDRGGTGETTLALEDVEVLDASPAPEGGSAANDAAGGERVIASLRVSVRQAVFLAAAQSFARELRLLPRAPGDQRRGAQGMRVDSGL